MKNILTCALSLFFLCSFCHRAAAWDTQWRVPDFAPRDFHPRGVAADANGFWAVGDALVRYDTAGNAIRALPFDRYDFVSISASGDGGFVATSDDETVPLAEPRIVECDVRAFAADGTRRWRTVVGYTCDQTVVDAQGTIWVTTGIGAQPTQPILYVFRLVALSARGDIVVDAQPGQPGAPIRQMLSAEGRGVSIYTGRAITQWPPELDAWTYTSSVPGDAPGAMTVAPDRRLLLAEPDIGAGKIRLAHVVPRGAATVFDTVSAAREVAAVAEADDGTIYLLERHADGSFLLRRIDAQGQTLWTIVPGDGGSDCARYQGRCALRVTHAGTAIVAMTGAAVADGQRGVDVESYSAAGARIAHGVMRGHLIGGLVALADDSTLVEAHYSFALDQVIGAPTSWLRFDGMGQLAPAPTAAAVRPHPACLVGSVTTAQGDTYAVAIGGDRPALMQEGESIAIEPFELSRVGSDGAPRWNLIGSGQWLAPTAITADEDRVCLGGPFWRGAAIGASLRTACYSADAGQELWHHDDTILSSSGRTELALTPQHELIGVARFSFDQGAPPRHRRYAANGDVRHDIELGAALPKLYSIAFDHAGNALMADRQRVASIDTDGVTRYVVEENTALNLGASDSFAPVSLHLADEGGATVYGVIPGSTTRAMLWLLDAQGRTRQLRQPFQNAADVRFSSVRVGARSIDLIAQGVAASVDSSAQAVATFAERRNTNDGALQWQRVLDANAYGTPVAAPDDATVLIASASEPHRLRLQWLSGIDGSDLAIHRDTCADDDCVFLGPRVTADGVLHLAIAGSDEGRERARVVTRRDAPTLSPGVDVLQSGLDGAWWAPYARGQGFSLDVTPSLRRFSMHWLTFTATPIDAADSQRWYLIEGNAYPGAHSLDLPIVEAQGAFGADSLGTTTVGRAVLRFADCDRASLHYRFDGGENVGLEGDVDLQRLTPRQSACILADDSVQSAPAAMPPANGFYAALSGTWQDTEARGQDLHLVVQPGTLFYASWATFMPSSDFFVVQRWFTVQGSLASAQNGAVTLPLIATSGGTFDGAPSDNHIAVGSAMVHVLDCAHLRLDYAFVDAPAAEFFAGISGHRDFVRVGGCIP